ncbi:uncharacterized protein [Nerophis lumbriciformis]|uniref:uncharacterized protein isoform X2 n=1 Tax=Nerophis lumbriciformis TaxID=546530 RepID=UPI002AE09F83|nr:uncharacterized protein LOC133589457 isoform X2 [Nerophis lumbriciformis]
MEQNDRNEIVKREGHRYLAERLRKMKVEMWKVHATLQENMEFPLMLAQMAPHHREVIEAKIRGIEFRGKQACLKTDMKTNRVEMDATLKIYQSALKIHQIAKSSYETARKTSETAGKTFETAGKTFETARKTFETARKTFETARKTFETDRRALDIEFSDLNCDLKLLQTKREHEIERAQLKAELGRGGPPASQPPGDGEDRDSANDNSQDVDNQSLSPSPPPGEGEDSAEGTSQDIEVDFQSLPPSPPPGAGEDSAEGTSQDPEMPAAKRPRK